jgi:type VI protein secretion system component VasK
VFAISFGEALWLIVVSFLFIAYLMMLFSVIADLFRDADLGGVAKAVWAVLLIFLPLITLLAYLIMRGKGMAERQMKEQVQAKEHFDSYVRDVAGNGAADELAKAADLRDQGKISDEEYTALKAKILA